MLSILWCSADKSPFTFTFITLNSQRAHWMVAISSLGKWKTLITYNNRVVACDNENRVLQKQLFKHLCCFFLKKCSKWAKEGERANKWIEKTHRKENNKLRDEYLRWFHFKDTSKCYCCFCHSQLRLWTRWCDVGWREDVTMNTCTIVRLL